MTRTISNRLPLRLEALDARVVPALLNAAGIYSPALDSLPAADQASIYNNVYNLNTIDVRVANGTLFVTGTPQSDTVDVPNDSQVTSSNSIQGSRIDSLLYSGSFSSIEFNGGGGNDTFTYPGTLPVLARGGAGNDAMTAGSGADLLVGDLGQDTLNGRDGNDVLWGDGIGQVSGTAPDGVNGSTMGDTLYGGEGNDYTYGGFGNDKVYGQGGNDIVNGGDGDDFLDGGAGADLVGAQGAWWAGVWLTSASENGNDRLFGGANDAADTLRGGAGNDRLLSPADSFTIFGIRVYTQEDSTPDFNRADDARMILLDGYTTTVTYSPTEIRTVTGVNWTDADVARTDEVFGVLQSNTNGKTTLLKKSDGSDMVIVRHGTTNRGWNDGWVHMTNAGLQYGDTTADNRNLHGYLLHEIGHNWQGNAFSSGGTSYWGQFMGQSGWRSTQPGWWEAANYTLSTNEGRGNRWYLKTAGFASGYARTNENEDFAESFAAYFTQQAGWVYYNGGAGAAAIPGKMSIFSTWASRL